LGSVFPTINQLLTSSSGISTATGTADFVGGTANALYNNGTLAPGYLVLINNAGAYFNPLPKNTVIGPTNNYPLQFGNIPGGTAEAQAFILLHELAHVLGLFQPDNGDTSAGAKNNDLMWYNCGKVIQSFSH